MAQDSKTVLQVVFDRARVPYRVQILDEKPLVDQASWEYANQICINDTWSPKGSKHKQSDVNVRKSFQEVQPTEDQISRFGSSMFFGRLLLKLQVLSASVNWNSPCSLSVCFESGTACCGYAADLRSLKVRGRLAK